MDEAVNRDRYKHRLLPVLRKIQDDLDAELDLHSLAQLAHMSQYHFHRIFKAVVGENLKSHLRRLRLERAAGLLRDTDERILDLAIGAGFASHEAFTRAFHKAFAVTPVDYRNCQARYVACESGIHFGAPLNDFNSQDHGKLTMQVSQTTFPEITVIYRHHIGVNNNMPQAWGELIQWAKQEKILGEGTRFISIGYDDPSITGPDKQRFDLCFTSEAEPKGTFPVKSRKIGGFKVAQVVHKGDLAGIENSFMQFYGNWLPASGLEPADHPPLVEYLNSPFNTPVPDLRTALIIPIKA